MILSITLESHEQEFHIDRDLDVNYVKLSAFSSNADFHLSIGFLDHHFIDTVLNGTTPSSQNTLLIMDTKTRQANFIKTESQCLTCSNSLSCQHWLVT